MYEDDIFRHISPREFDEIDLNTVTLVDLREPHEVQASGIEDALVMPFSKGYDQFDTLPQDRP